MTVTSDGCGNTAPSGSYGDRFNALGGGVYATEVLPDSIKIWHFPRSAVPADLQAGTPDPARWPAPFFNAQRSTRGCDVAGYFKKQTIVRPSCRTKLAYLIVMLTRD